MRTAPPASPLASSPSGNLARDNTGLVWPARVCKHSPEGQEEKCALTAPQSPHRVPQTALTFQGVQPNLSVKTPTRQHTVGECHHSHDVGRVPYCGHTVTFPKGYCCQLHVCLSPLTLCCVHTFRVLSTLPLANRSAATQHKAITICEWPLRVQRRCPLQGWAQL